MAEIKNIFAAGGSPVLNREDQEEWLWNVVPGWGGEKHHRLSVGKTESSQDNFTLRVYQPVWQWPG